MVWASTGNTFYAISGIHPGATLAAAKRRLRGGNLLKVGHNQWYEVALGNVTGVLEVRGGIVQQVALPRKLLREPEAHR